MYAVCYRFLKTVLLIPRIVGAMHTVKPYKFGAVISSAVSGTQQNIQSKFETDLRLSLFQSVYMLEILFKPSV